MGHTQKNQALSNIEISEEEITDETILNTFSLFLSLGRNLHIPQTNTNGNATKLLALTTVIRA